MASETLLVILAVLLTLLSLVCYLALRFFIKARSKAYPRQPKFQPLNLRTGQTLAQSIYNPPTYSLSVIIPAFKEEGRIGEMLADTIRYLEGRSQSEDKFTAEVIVVDDGSPDKTAIMVKKETARLRPQITDVKLICFSVNQGKGAAVSEGVLAAHGKRILFADADGATRIEEVERLELALAKKFGVACGSRFAQRCSTNVVKRNALRKRLMEYFHHFIQMVGVDIVRDTQCGFKLFSREAARKIFPNLRLSGWIFDVEALILAKAFRIKVVEVPVSWTEKGGSKLRLAVDSFGMAFDLLLMRFAYESRIWKVYGKYS